MLRSFATAAAAAVFVGAALAAASAVSNAGTTATVVGIESGDTVLVDRAGQTFAVRLLGVDTPGPGAEGVQQCLEAEATAFLRKQLPVGTQIRLLSLQEEPDPNETALAALSVDDSLIGPEIARAGLGVAISGGVHDPYAAEVAAAQRESQRHQRGLHSAEVACTVPARVRALETAAESSQRAAGAATDLAAVDARERELLDLQARSDALLKELSGSSDEWPMLAYTTGDSEQLQARVRAVDGAVEGMLTVAQQARDTILEQQRQEAEAAAAEAARRQAAEQARDAAPAQSAESGAVDGSTGEAGSRSSSGSSTPTGGSGKPAPAAPVPVPAPPPPAPAPSAPTPSGAAMTDSEKAMISATNAARAVGRTCGSYGYFPPAPPLSANGLLAVAAQAHADDMAVHDVVSHTGSDGSKVGDRINRTGYSWSWSSENIAGGYATPSAAVQALLESPSHCRNIMDGRLTQIGIGYAYNGSSTYRHHWVQVLAAPR